MISTESKLAQTLSVPSLARFLILSIASCCALADSPPSWKPFAVTSKNSLFIAKVEVGDKKGKSAPWKWQYKLSVFATVTPTNALWEAAYAFDGYDGGTLSNDGLYFVYADFWYRHNTPVVSIYNQGGTWRFTGDELHIEQETLQKTVSHQLWLKDGNDSVAFLPASETPTKILISTVQGERYVRVEAKPSIEAVRDETSPLQPATLKR